jgi:hypothetical protein
MRIVKSLLPVLLLATCFSSAFSSLSYAATPDRIASIDSANVVVLKGHVSPMARAQFDRGPVESSRTMRVTMLFLPSAQQQAALEKLIAQQQDPTSPNYHQWLTAVQYGQQFGLSQNDLDKVSVWLKGQGFKITYVAKGQDFLSFEGSAAQVQRALQTEMHSFNVNGRMHFANVTAPAIPASLRGIVGGFRGLHDFFPRPMIKPHANYSDSNFNTHFLAPGDLATIYDITPLYSAATPIDGTGQTVVIAGQTDVYLADLVNFRNGFGLAAITGCNTSNGIIAVGTCTSGNFQMVVPGTAFDPGLSPGDLGESDLDIETMSGVARGAKIIFVTSSNGVDDSATWAIDNQLAPVISYSYGLCEAFVVAPNIAAAEPEYKKADALGISFFAATGDAAAATCDGDGGTFPATLGPSVSYPASSAYLTGVGGTEFNENGGTYWSTTNGTNGASVLTNGPQNGYIPEIAWNDTVLAGQLDGTGGGPSNCVNGTGTTSVDGFQFRVCSAPPNGGFPKPSWQTALTPADSVRDVPDISFSASNANDLFIVCAPESEVSNTNSSTSTCQVSIKDALDTWLSAFGGTSASTPVAAGMTVLLNQYLGANGLGNVNPELYKLYVSNPAAFHDVTTATSPFTGATSDNIVACAGGTPGSMPGFTTWPAALNCPGASGTTGSFGYSVVGGHHYSRVTGLGSVDMNALFTAWAASSARTGSSVTISPSSTSVQAGTNVTFTATVAPATGTGSVTFSSVNNSATTVLGTALINLPYPAATTGTATLSTTALPGGSNSVTAKYEGDGSNKASTSAAVVVTVLAPDFTLAAAPGSTSVIAGHTSSPITITLVPVQGFNQVITPSCTTGLPTGATCAFNPTTVQMDGTNTKTTSMTVVTAASMATGNGTAVTISASGSGTTHTSAFSLTVTTTDQSFSLAPQSATYSVTQGQSANATLTLTPTAGFNTPVTYTCGDPANESTCTGPVGATATTTPGFTVTTTHPSRARATPLGRGTQIFYAALLPGLLGIMFTAGSRKRSLRGMRLLGLIVALGFSTLWLGSCSGTNSGGTKDPGTATGPYTITINATTGGANPLTAQTTFTLQVN